MGKLAEGDVCATLGVKNLDEARTFYGETLGLGLVDDNFGGLMYKSGNSKLFVYESQFAGTNQATAASWMVDDITAAVDELKAAGVTFERYDGMPGEWQGEVNVVEGMKAAWFKDPSGNILNVGSTS